MSLYAKILKVTSQVVNVESATQEWVDDWTSVNPDSEYAYYYGWEEEPTKSAGIGRTWDEPTTWFIPQSPGPDFIFDRDEWRWIPDTVS